MASAGQSAEQARQAQDVDAIPTLAWSARPDGSAEFLNRRWLDYTGLSTEEASDWGWTAALHPEDRDRLMDFWRHLLDSGKAGEIEARLRRYDGDYRWFLFRVEIQFLLGHVSIQTTERCKQRFHDAVNDHIGLEPDAPS